MPDPDYSTELLTALSISSLHIACSSVIIFFNLSSILLCFWCIFLRVYFCLSLFDLLTSVLTVLLIMYVCYTCFKMKVES